MNYFTGIPDLPLVWRRYRIRVRFVADGEAQRRLRKEIETRVCSLPRPAGTRIKLKLILFNLFF